MRRIQFEHILAAILIAAILFGVILRVMNLTKDITAEESDFVKPAIAIIETGRPLFYHSGQQPHELALWHPPLYIFTLSLFLRGGTSEIVARLPNFIAIVGTALFISLFVYLSSVSRKKKLIALALAAFFLINYYVLSSSMIIDIDGFATFFTTGFVVCAALAVAKNENKLFIPASFFLIFAIANRFQIALAVYCAIGFYLLLDKNSKNHRVSYIVAGIVAVTLFSLTWAYYSTVVEPGNLFSFIKHNSKLGSELMSSSFLYLSSFILNLVQFAKLFTFPATILLGMSVVHTIRKKNRALNIILISTLTIFLLFVLIPRPAFGYPRYFASMLPSASILIIVLISDAVKKIKITPLFISTLIISSAIYCAFIVLTGDSPALYRSDGLIQATKISSVLIPLIAVCIICFEAVIPRVRAKKELFIILLFLTSCIHSAYFDIIYTAYEPAIKDVGEYLKEKTPPDGIVLCPKAVGYYYGREFFVNDYTKPRLEFSPAHLQEYIWRTFQNPSLDTEFFWNDDLYGGINPPQPSSETLQKVVYVVRYNQIERIPAEKKIGSFYIYRTS